MGIQTFTTVGFSQEIGVHLNTVLKWIHSGKVRAQKNASNRWEIPATEVDRMKGQIIQEKVGKAAFRSLEVRWRHGLVDRMTDLLIAAQRYRMDMWEWKQEEDPIQQQKILDRVLRVSFPELLKQSAEAERWHDLAELATEIFKDVEARLDRNKATP
jgi:hypothetical protein